MNMFTDYCRKFARWIGGGTFHYIYVKSSTRPVVVVGFGRPTSKMPLIDFPQMVNYDVKHIWFTQFHKGTECSIIKRVGICLLITLIASSEHFLHIHCHV